MTRKYSPPTTKDIEKAQAKAAKVAEASKGRARAHKARLAREGEAGNIPFPKRKNDD